MKIKKGDNIIVISGKHKGQKGTVAKTLPEVSRVLVTGVNKVKRHQKPKTRNEKGSIIEVEAPIHSSNVMVLDPKSGTPTRIGKKKVGDAYVRIAKKSGQELK